MSPYIESSKQEESSTIRSAMNTFPTVNESAAILLNSWDKHGSLIIAIDFDDTIFDFYDKGLKHQKRLIELLLEAQKLKCFRYVIYTAAERSRWNQIREFCSTEGLDIAGINVNLIKTESGIGENGKIYYNLLLDDKAGLMLAFLVLKRTVEQIKNIIDGKRI